MLGSVPSKTRETEYLERLKQVLDSIAYTAPELADRRRTQIIAEARHVIREWEGGR